MAHNQPCRQIPWPDAKTVVTTVNIMSRRLSIITGIDSNTVASNPGRIKLQPLHYWNCLRLPLFLSLVVGAIAGAGLTYKLGLGQGALSPWIFVASMMAGTMVMAFVQTAFAMQSVMDGDTNPAIVVDPSKGLIAVWANMSSGNDFVPAVKVLRMPLARAAGSPYQQGQRLTTVSTYKGSRDKPYWTDFNPLPVPCVTTDADAIRDSLARVSADEWEYLEAGLVQLGQSVFRPGIYFLEPKPN
jgi:hypothetical protein